MTTRWLVLLRHAKAAHPPGIADIARPLTERGHADAAAAGAWLSGRGYPLELVLCSPARRTRQTWQGAARAFAGQPLVEFPDEAYEAGAAELLDLVREVPEAIGGVLLVGHNPAISQLSALLDPDTADPDGLRTGGLAVHCADGGWAELTPGRAPLRVAHTARA